MTHDLGGIDRVERVRVAVGDHRDLVVHLIDEPAQVAVVEMVQLGIAGELVEVARDVDVTVVVGLVGADDMTACTQDGLRQLGVQRLGALG